MIRKYHNHELQKNPWHREEEPHNNHETPERQAKQSNQLSLPHQDDCNTDLKQTCFVTKLSPNNQITSTKPSVDTTERN